MQRRQGMPRQESCPATEIAGWDQGPCPLQALFITAASDSSPCGGAERASEGRREAGKAPVRNITKETPLAGAATLAFDPENF